MLQFIVIPCLKLMKLFKIQMLMNKFFDNLIPKLITNVFGMPSLTDKYTKIKTSSFNTASKMKNVAKNFKEKSKNSKEKKKEKKAKRDLKDKNIFLFDKKEDELNSTDDTTENNKVVVGAVKHIMANVSDTLSTNNKEKKMLKIKDGKPSSAPTSEDEEQVNNKIDDKDNK